MFAILLKQKTAPVLLLVFIFIMVFSSVANEKETLIKIQKASLVEKNNRTEIRTRQMSLSIPVKPALENKLQDAFVIKKR